MSERFKVQSWKGCVGAIPPGVRIPSSLYLKIQYKDKGMRTPEQSVNFVSGSNASRAEPRAKRETGTFNGITRVMTLKVEAAAFNARLSEPKE